MSESPSAAPQQQNEEEGTRMDGSKVDREALATAAWGLETKGATAPLSS